VAKLRPFNAIRYAHDEGADISSLTAPPYDVVGPVERERLIAGDPHNVVALELPEGPLDPDVPGNRYETGALRWRRWLSKGVLVKDARPAVYLVEQGFSLRGRDVRRRALVAEIGLEPFSAGVVVPHERTLPKALDDRLRLTRACAANLSQVLALYPDPDHETGALLDGAVEGPPLATATDAEGVESRLWAVTDPDAHRALADHFGDRRVYIADGHHRYTTALAYRDERRAEDPARPTDTLPAYEGIMMALVSMDDPDLVVLPTHRVVDADVRPFGPDAFRDELASAFELTPAGDGIEDDLAEADGPAFGVLTPADGVTVLARLRDDVDPAARIARQASPAWKRLDVAVLQELVLDPLLDVHPDRPATLERLSFVKDIETALAITGHDVVFLLRPTEMDQLKEVTASGETMPQKSTYFYPKVLSGLLFRSLD
jgi:uncharacterized protein (DUF1015 family)